MQFVTGVQGSIGSYPDDIMHLKNTADRLIGPDNYQWSVIGAGLNYVKTATLAISLGGHVRVGMEDNIFIQRGQLAKTNAELVQKIVRIANEFGREIATPEYVRNILKLKGKENTNF
jgi:uncharacterized protein (DUF849 family)